MSKDRSAIEYDFECGVNVMACTPDPVDVPDMPGIRFVVTQMLRGKSDTFVFHYSIEDLKELIRCAENSEGA